MLFLIGLILCYLKYPFEGDHIRCNGLTYNICNAPITTCHLIKKSDSISCLLGLTHYIYFLLGNVLLLEHHKDCILNHCNWYTLFQRFAVGFSSSQLSKGTWFMHSTSTTILKHYLNYLLLRLIIFKLGWHMELYVAGMKKLKPMYPSQLY
jgi:cellulose synthase/poly-beta-1,6-N-acetylglucosamine synthase-like glycosyltransferase